MAIEVGEAPKRGAIPVREEVGGVFVAEATYPEKWLVKGAGEVLGDWRKGFSWDPKKRHWFTKSPEAARLLSDTKSLASAIISKAQGRETAIASSRAAVSDAVIPAPPGREYRPYQKAGIAAMSTRASNLLGDDMGLGKTVQAIGLINMDPSIRRVLVICPASLKLNWQIELRRWLVRELSVAIANGKFPNADVVIMNYDIAKKHSAATHAIQWDLVILDEAHYLKNPKSQRAEAILGGRDKKGNVTAVPVPAKRRLAMTGTPIPNRPVEIWPLVQWLGAFDNFFHFAKRYCGAVQNEIRVKGGARKLVWDFTGSSNLPELQERLRASVMVRRLKGDVLTELPPKTHQMIVLPCEGELASLVEEEAAYWDDTEMWQARVEVARLGDDQAEITFAEEKLRRAQAISFEQASEIRRRVGIAKIPHAVEALLDIDHKVVVFAHHHEVIDALVAALPGRCVKLDGRDSAQERQSAVERFQSDPSVQFFIGGIKAAGVGLTLTAASHVLFVEQDWTPGNMTQAEDRCHRIGQTGNVLVQYLAVDRSIDARMIELLIEKTGVIHAALDALPKVAVPKARPASSVAAGRGTNRSGEEAGHHAAEQEVRLDSSVVEAVQAGLRSICAACDGAHSDDGMGFGKFDVRIGHELATRGSLSNRQAAAGLKLVRKYRRQVSQEILAKCGIV